MKNMNVLHIRGEISGLLEGEGVRTWVRPRQYENLETDVW